MSADQSPAQTRDVPRGMDRLLHLQDLDLAIDRLNTRLVALESEEEVRSTRSQVQQAESRVGEVKLALDGVVREQHRLESDVDSMEQKIQAEQKRMYDGSVANPKELQSIGAEVESLKGRKSRTEDVLLERMEQREELEGRLVPLEAEVVQAREALVQMEETSGRELVEIERTLEATAAERKKLADEIDPELLDLYEDLRRQKKGVGAAALVDGVCQGCHQKLSAVYLDRLKRGDGIRRCEYCRRILVFG